MKNKKVLIIILSLLLVFIVCFTYVITRSTRTNKEHFPPNLIDNPIHKVARQNIVEQKEDPYDLEMLKTSDDSTGKSCSNPDKIIEGCKKGETVETVSKEGGFTAKFTCLGVIDDKVVDYKHFKLKNGNVLLYSESNPLKRAKVFDSKTNKFLEVSKDIKTTNYPVYTKKELPKNLNLFTPRLLFDTKTNEFLVISNNEYSKYRKFITERKFNSKNISLIERFSNHEFLYAAKTSRYLGPSAYNIVWLEDPVKLIRYKKGKLNVERDMFSAQMVDNKNVFIVGGSLGVDKFKDFQAFTNYYNKKNNNASLIEIYNPEKGTINVLGSINDGHIGQKNLVLFNKIMFITNRHPSNYVKIWKREMYNASSILFENTKSYLKVTPLFDNFVLIYSSKNKAKIYNDLNNYKYDILPLVRRVNPQMTAIDKNKVLITGGQKGFEESCCFSTAELFVFKSK